jgi:tRNA-specific 2-thiouridylase
MKIALSLGADYVATGHYCRKSQTKGSTVYQLRAGADNNKDQSYFLCHYHKNNYQNLYSIGELTKPEVREIAQMELVT